MEEIDKLVDRIEYRDGVLYWGKGARLAGKEAGCKSRGYIIIRYKSGNKNYILAHRLIFYMFHGYLPELIDHIDRDTTNNRIDNLRAADKSINSINRGLQSNNTSGYRGVSFHAGKWESYIGAGKSRIRLGRFKYKEDAIQAREAAEQKYWGDIL